MASVAGTWPSLTLILVTMAWGSQHAVARMVVEHDAATLTMARFGVAAVCLAPWIPRDEKIWRQGIELGLLAFLGFAFQTQGLETTTATRSAFLLYLNVKFVPVILALRGEPQPPFVWGSAILAVLGTGLLASDGGGLQASWCPGDGLSLVAALASALFIVRLGDFRSPNPAQLASASALVTFTLAVVWVLLAQDHQTTPSGGGTTFLLFAGAAVYLGAVPSALCGVLQTAAQAVIPSTRAAVVYALDPLWAALFARLLLAESLGPTGLTGTGLVLLAAFASPLRDLLLLDELGDNDSLPGVVMTPDDIGAAAFDNNTLLRPPPAAVAAAVNDTITMSSSITASTSYHRRVL